MSTDASGADAAVRAEIARAFAELRPHVIANARKDADLDPASRLGAFSDADLEQIVNAWAGMFTEALEGSGRETRELIFDTALPPILELGQTALDMARSSVISGVMLTSRLLPLIAPEHREAAARWLAGYYGEYVHDLVGRVMALKGEGR